MGIKRLNYKNKILKETIIPKLRNDIPYLDNNVYYEFPNDESKFPLCVIGINDSPLTYDVNQTEMISAITIEMSILDEHISDCIDLEFEISNVMLGLGYTRQEPTTPYRNEKYDKFQIDIRYRIAYNLLNETFQRLI